jgi:hypothetical protein
MSNLNIQGKRVRIDRWVHAPSCVVRVQVDAVIPVDDPSEPCIEPEAVAFLRDVRRHAEQNDIAWLKSIGDGFVRVPA